jgi:hypothetical protein
MRYIMMVKGTKASEAGVMPTLAQMAEMGVYNDALIRAGVLIDAAGLHATSKGAKIRFSGESKTLIQGPFADSSDIVSGFWIINVRSPEEAMAWAMQAPNPAFGSDGEIEIRRLFEPEDFAPATAS